jgi:hypothetical protein
MGWKVRVSNPGSGEIFCAHPMHLRGTNNPCVVGIGEPLWGHISQGVALLPSHICSWSSSKSSPTLLTLICSFVAWYDVNLLFLLFNNLFQQAVCGKHFYNARNTIAFFCRLFWGILRHKKNVNSNDLHLFNTVGTCFLLWARYLFLHRCKTGWLKKYIWIHQTA